MTGWLHIVLGAWVLISPWLFGLSGNTLLLWSNVAVGLVVILANIWMIFGTESARQVPEALPERKVSPRKEKQERSSPQ